MPGNIADQQVQIFAIERADQAEVAANGADRVKVGLDAQSAPDKRLRRKALLNTSGQREILFDFLLALFEAVIGVAQLSFGCFLIGNVGESDDGEIAAIGIFDARELMMTGRRLPSF